MLKINKTYRLIVEEKEPQVFVFNQFEHFQYFRLRRFLREFEEGDDWIGPDGRPATRESIVRHLGVLSTTMQRRLSEIGFTRPGCPPECPA